MRNFIVIGLVLLAACTSTPPVADPVPPKPTCGQGGPCGENERPN